jgi:entericidin B
MRLPHVRQRTDASRRGAHHSRQRPPLLTVVFTRRSIMARKVLTVLMMLGILGSMSALSACNTVAGAGKDIERGGEKVQGAAKDVQQKM